MGAQSVSGASSYFLHSGTVNCAVVQGRGERAQPKLGFVTEQNWLQDSGELGSPALEWRGWVSSNQMHCLYTTYIIYMESGDPTLLPLHISWFCMRFSLLVHSFFGT